MTNEFSDEEFLELAYERLFSGDCFDEGEIDRLLSLAKKGLKAEKLKEALEFYGDKSNWTINEDYDGYINEGWIDIEDVEYPERKENSWSGYGYGGKRARAAIKEFNE